ncbi:MAG: hypothetical protein ACUVUE_06670, partial [Candidatus Bathycorpusculaceae bacterium]
MAVLDRSVQKEFVEELKAEWRRLWWERIDDRARAEGIAKNDYSSLFVDKGTVIVATRDYKPLSFREILEAHKLFGAERFLPPPPAVGGWGKFIRTAITGQNLRGRRTRERYPPAGEAEKGRQQLKKGGRGWLHV